MKSGFTLIELVVVIAILGILAAILIPVIGGFINRANIAADEANARNVYNTVSMYLASEKDPETTADGILAAESFQELFGSDEWPTPRSEGDFSISFTTEGNSTIVELVTVGEASYPPVGGS